MEKKHLSGFKVYAIVVGAILTCVVLIGALFFVNAVNTAQRQGRTARTTANHDDVKSREDQLFYLAEQIPGGFDLYYDYYMRLTQDTTEEEKNVKLDKLEAKLRQMQQGQLEREAARLQQLQQSPTP